MNLIRDILLAIEAHDFPDDAWVVSLPNIPHPRVQYHIRLLQGAGLVDAVLHASGSGSQNYSIRGLTMEGHDVLDTIRHDTVWSKVLEHAKATGVAMSMEAAAPD